MAVFPGKPPNPLGLKVELNLAGVWTDITQYVYQRDMLQVTGMGRTDEASAMQASQLTLTLKNGDGRFTPRNAAGAYYPNIVRNTPIRVSVNATSQPPASVPYSGYRYQGEVSSWPPTSDISQHDVYVQVTASGIWRRISQSQATIGSSYSRYMTQLTGVNVPATSWTMEDGTGSPVFSATIGAGRAAAFTGLPSLAQDGTSFPGSDALPQFNNAKIIMPVISGATPTSNVTRYALAVPAGGDSNAGASRWCISETDSGGTFAKLEVFLNPAGTLTLEGHDSSGTRLISATTATSVQGRPVLVSAELTPSGSGIAWALRIIAPNGTSVLESQAGATASGTISAVTQVVLNRAAALSNTTIGQLGVFYAVPSLITAAAALGGHIGEFAVVRFQRLCAEFSIASEVIGSASAAMGPQVDDTLANLLTVIESTDGGLLYESTSQPGLGYRTLASMKDQSPAVTLNYAAGVLGAPLASTYDDQLLKNQWTVQNWDGYAALATLTSGALSVQPVPNGAGLYAGGPLSVSAASHDQVLAIAQQRLFQGTVDDVRYPQVSVNFKRGTAAGLFASVPALRPGDYIQVTNLPAFDGGGTAGTQSGSLTSPGTFNSILILTLPPGPYTVTWTVTLGGTTGAGDANNFRLVNGVTVIATSVNAGAAGSYPQAVQTFTVTAANAFIQIGVGGSTPTTGSVYSATVTATPVPAKQLVWGWEETLNAFTWSQVLNTVPELPFESLFSPGVYSVTQAPSGTVASGSPVGSSVAGSQIGAGAVGSGTIATTLSARGIGGVTAFISAATPYDWSFAVSAIPGTGLALARLAAAAGTALMPSVKTSAGIAVQAGLAAGTGAALGLGLTAVPADQTYFICTVQQAVPNAIGDTFTHSAGLGGPFTVTGVDPPSGGTVSVHFNPPASSVMATGTVFGGKNGDTWINTSAGNQVIQWQAGAWVPVTWNAANVIQAATIVASLIAAGTITAGLLAAGIVKAGIVDATTITGAQFVSTGAMSGDYLAYNGSPAANNLVMSEAIAAFTDAHSNSGLAGFAVYGGVSGAWTAIALNPASAVQGLTLYQSSNANMTAWTEAGLLIPAQVNYATWTVTAATWTQACKSFDVPASTSQVNTMYRLTCKGNGQYGTPTPSAFWLRGNYTGGAGMGKVQFGDLCYAAGTLMQWEIVIDFIITTTGAAGTWKATTRATMSAAGVNIIQGNNTQGSFSSLDGGNGSIDTTTDFGIWLEIEWPTAPSNLGSATTQEAIFERLGA